MQTINKHVDKPLAPDEFSVRGSILKFGEYRRFVFQKWKVILLFAIIGGALGFTYAKLRKTIYTAECTFVLEESEKGGGGLGQYSALASMVGIDVGSSSGLFQGDNITQLYKSRLMLEKTLLTRVTFKSVPQLLIDRYIHMNDLTEAWSKNSKLKNLRFDIPKENFTIVHDSIMNVVVADINKNYLIIDKPDKKLSMVSIKTKAKDQLFAKMFTETIVNNVNAFYVQTKTKGGIQNVLLLQSQADSVKRILNSSIGGTAAALDIYPNANPARQSLRVQSRRKEVDVQATTAIYAEVIKNLEVARGILQRETPLIQVIDQPVLPLPNDRVGKGKATVTGIIIAVLLGMIWLITLKVYHSIMT